MNIDNPVYSPQQAARSPAGWSSRVDEVLQEATLQKPADVAYSWHGKRGQHSEHLSRLLAEMQIMQRTYPGAQW